MICKKCGKNFPQTIKIDGKTKNLSNRSHCLDCVPFGKRFSVEKNVELEHCVCTVCGREYMYHHTTSHTRKKCNSCLVNVQKEHKRIKSIEYLGGKCKLCGYDKCLRALCFHHIDPSTKLFGISGSHCRSWVEIQKELDKCILLCHNCHMEVEDGMTEIKFDKERYLL